jgi:hypothetical protein
MILLALFFHMLLSFLYFFIWSCRIFSI